MKLTKRFVVMALAVMLCVNLMTIGCASFGVWSPGAQAVVNFLCDPTDAQKAEAAKWLTAMDSIQAGIAVAYPPAALAKASAVMTALKNGSCFFLDEVEAALILIADMQTQQAKLKGKGLAGPVSAQVQFPVLWATVKTGK